MEIEDFSSLRDLNDGPIVVPLNGKKYKADPHPPADVPLAATTGVSSIALDAMAKIGDGVELTQQEQAAAAAAGSSSMTKAVIFLQQVLEPESLELWTYHMRPADPEWDARKKAEHRKHKITLRQLVAVYRALIQQYSGGRPTTAPSSSENGHDGAGVTSTAGVQPPEA